MNSGPAAKAIYSRWELFVCRAPLPYNTRNLRPDRQKNALSDLCASVVNTHNHRVGFLTLAASLELPVQFFPRKQEEDRSAVRTGAGQAKEAQIPNQLLQFLLVQ